MHAKPCIDARFVLKRSGFTLDVDLTLNGDGITVIQGASGSGKTTLLRCIAGLEQPDIALLQVNGTTWQSDKFSLPTYQRSIGYVFQEDSLFEHLSVKKNILFGCLDRKSITAFLMPIIDLLGINQLLDRKPGTLSGGERQRIAIARAFAVKPEVLLMDEPLSALDASKRHDILNMLLDIQSISKVPIIYVTHSPAEAAKLAGQIIFMDAGRLI